MEILRRRDAHEALPAVRRGREGRVGAQRPDGGELPVHIQRGQRVARRGRDVPVDAQTLDAARAGCARKRKVCARAAGRGGQRFLRPERTQAEPGAIRRVQQCQCECAEAERHVRKKDGRLSPAAREFIDACREEYAAGR